MTSVDQPKIQVTLVKRVARIKGQSERFQGSQRKIDLTDFLGDGCVVSTVKDIRQPAGCFTITLVDQGDFRQGDGGRGVLDTVYGVVEPMDYVEVRFARTPGTLPIIMRGFVSSVRRSEGMAGDKPVRRVIITGHDFGKIAQIVRIFLRADYGQAFSDSADTTFILSTFRLYARTGKFGTIMSPLDFMNDCMSILNAYLTTMVQYTDTAKDIPALQLDASVTQGMVSPFTMQMFGGDEGGSIWELMTSYADTPWNELFIEDRDKGPFIVYRPCPFLGLDDKTPVVTGAAALKPVVTIQAADIISLDVERGDADVANYFWVEAPISTLQTVSMLNVESLAKGQIVVKDNPNCNPKLYGLKRISAQSNLMDPRWNTVDDSANAAKKVEYSQRQLDWITIRRDQLKAMNQDNVIFDKGHLRIKGNEKVKSGTYFKVQRGGFTWIAYAAAVSHDYQVFGNFTTLVAFERGTGFLRRVQSTPSPYYLEGAQGPYV